MTKTARARYMLEFKREAVRLVERPEHRSGAESKPVSAEQMEISRLRAELG